MPTRRKYKHTGLGVTWHQVTSCDGGKTKEASGEAKCQGGEVKPKAQVEVDKTEEGE